MNLIITTTNIYKSTFIVMNYVQLIDFKLGILSSVWLSCFICPFQFRRPHLNQIMKQLLYDKCLSTDNFYIIDKPCCPRGLIYNEGCHSLSSIISDLQHHKGYRKDNTVVIYHTNRAYERGVQPIHRSGDRRSHEGAYESQKCPQPQPQTFYFDFFFIFRGIFNYFLFYLEIFKNNYVKFTQTRKAITSLYMYNI